MFRLSINSKEKEEAGRKAPASPTFTKRVEAFSERVAKGRNEQYQQRAKSLVRKVNAIEQAIHKW